MRPATGRRAYVYQRLSANAAGSGRRGHTHDRRASLVPGGVGIVGVGVRPQPTASRRSSLSLTSWLVRGPGRGRARSPSRRMTSSTPAYSDRRRRSSLLRRRRNHSTPRVNRIAPMASAATVLRFCLQRRHAAVTRVAPLTNRSVDARERRLSQCTPGGHAQR